MLPSDLFESLLDSGPPSAHVHVYHQARILECFHTVMILWPIKGVSKAIAIILDLVTPPKGLSWTAPTINISPIPCVRKTLSHSCPEYNSFSFITLCSSHCGHLYKDRGERIDTLGLEDKIPYQGVSERWPEPLHNLQGYHTAVSPSKGKS